MKRCSACGLHKPLEEFFRRGPGRRASCKLCDGIRYHAKVALDPEKERASKRAARRRRRVIQDYGFESREQYEAERDAGRCAICGCSHLERSLVYDHDHATGANRGWLCGLHNSGLGFFQDDPILLRAAADYLEVGRVCSG